MIKVVEEVSRINDIAVMQENVKERGTADPCSQSPCPEEALCLRRSGGPSASSCKCREGFREVDGVCEEVAAETRASNCSELDCHRGRYVNQMFTILYQKNAQGLDSICI